MIDGIASFYDHDLEDDTSSPSTSMYRLWRRKVGPFSRTLCIVDLRFSGKVSYRTSLVDEGASIRVP